MGVRRFYNVILSSLLITGGFFYFFLPHWQKEPREAPHSFSEAGAKCGWVCKINQIVRLTDFIDIANAAEQDVIITEIMYNPNGADAKHEWVELKNLGSASVIVAGGSGTGSWRIFDGANHTLATTTVLESNQYLLIVQDSATFFADHPIFRGVLVQSSALSLVNTTGTVALRLGSTGALWSQVNYFNSWGGDGNGKTLEKINLGGDNSKANWRESAVAGGTPGADNSLAAASPPPASSAVDQPLAETASTQLVVEDKPSYQAGSVVINEWVSDPNEEESEWVELYSRLPTSLDLTGWWLEDGSEAETPITGVISGQGFLVIKNPKGRLNNGGDALALKDAQGQLINQVIYGKWDSGPTNHHAPVAYNGQSVGRFSDGLATGNDANDFAISAMPTPGFPNQVERGLPTSASLLDAHATPVAQSDIILNELLPNPSGSDSEGEFIEIKNVGNQEVDLKGYTIKNDQSNFTITAPTIIKPQGLLVFKRPATGLVLKNFGTEKVQLWNNQKVLLDEVKYDEEAPEDFSFGRCTPLTSSTTAGVSPCAATSTTWLWSEVPTPAADNLYKAPNRPPLPSVVFPALAQIGETVMFDASDSSDPESNALSFKWSFGDKQTATGTVVSHVYKKAGSRAIKLEVSDGQGQSVIWRGIISIEESDSGETSANSSDATNINSKHSSGQFIKVKGIVTAPPGILGSQIFYLQDHENGYQVYSSGKKFPDLKIGDLVVVRGVASQVQNISRIKIKQVEDIDILSTENKMEPAMVSIADLSDEMSGSLLRVVGEVAEPKKQNFYLIDDGGEIKVIYGKKSGLAGEVVKEGDRVSVMGILVTSKDSFTLEPRQTSDVQIIKSALEETAPNQAGQGQTKKYLEVTAGGLSGLLAALMLRTRGAALKTVVSGFTERLPWKKKPDVS